MMGNSLQRAIYLGLVKVTENMLLGRSFDKQEDCDSNSRTGLSFMKQFLDVILKWKKLYMSTNSEKKKMICDVLHECYTFLELYGTGGGNFRLLYHQFLTESYSLCNFIELEWISLCSSIASHWTEFSQKLFELALQGKAKEGEGDARENKEENRIELEAIWLSVEDVFSTLIKEETELWTSIYNKLKLNCKL